MQKHFIRNSWIIFVLWSKVFCQSDADLYLIKNHNNYIFVFENKRQVTYMFKDKNFLVRYNPISLVFGGLLFIYQKYISAQMGANCPYEISCSAFSKQCIKTYGLIYGIPLTADRLTRCTRLASFDLIRGVEYNSRTNKIFDHPNDYSLKK